MRAGSHHPSFPGSRAAASWRNGAERQYCSRGSPRSYVRTDEVEVNARALYIIDYRKKLPPAPSPPPSFLPSVTYSLEFLPNSIYGGRVGAWTATGEALAGSGCLPAYGGHGKASRYPSASVGRHPSAPTAHRRAQHWSASCPYYATFFWVD